MASSSSKSGQCSLQQLSPTSTYLTSVLRPFINHDAKIPDANALATVTATTISSETFTSSGHSQLLVFQPQNRKFPLRVYEFYTPDSRYYPSFDLSFDRTLTDDYDKGRYVSGGLTLVSTTLSAGNFSVSGTFTAVTCNERPDVRRLPVGSILGERTPDSLYLAQVPINQGIVALGAPIFDQPVTELPQFEWHERSGAQIDYGPLHQSTLGEGFQSTFQGYGVRGWSTQPVLVPAVPVPIFSFNDYTPDVTVLGSNYGRMSLEVDISYTSSAAAAITFTAHLVGLTARAGIRQTVARTRAVTRQTHAAGATESVIMRYEADATFDVSEVYMTAESVTATNITIAYGRVKFLNHDRLTQDMRGPTTLISIDGVEAGTQISLNATINYEVTPTRRSLRLVKGTPPSPNDLAELNLLERIFDDSTGPVRRIFTQAEYDELCRDTIAVLASPGAVVGHASSRFSRAWAKIKPAFFKFLAGSVDQIAPHLGTLGGLVHPALGAAGEGLSTAYRQYGRPELVSRGYLSDRPTPLGPFGAIGLASSPGSGVDELAAMREELNRLRAEMARMKEGGAQTLPQLHVPKRVASNPNGMNLVMTDASGRSYRPSALQPQPVDVRPGSLGGLRGNVFSVSRYIAIVVNESISLPPTPQFEFLLISTVPISSPAVGDHEYIKHTDGDMAIYMDTRFMQTSEEILKVLAECFRIGPLAEAGPSYYVSTYGGNYPIMGESWHLAAMVAAAMIPSRGYCYTGVLSGGQWVTPDDVALKAQIAGQGAVLVVPGETQFFQEVLISGQLLDAALVPDLDPNTGIGGGRITIPNRLFPLVLYALPRYYDRPGVTSAPLFEEAVQSRVLPKPVVAPPVKRYPFDITFLGSKYTIPDYAQAQVWWDAHKEMGEYGVSKIPDGAAILRSAVEDMARQDSAPSAVKRLAQLASAGNALYQAARVAPSVAKTGGTGRPVLSIARANPAAKPVLRFSRMVPTAPAAAVTVGGGGPSSAPADAPAGPPGGGTPTGVDVSPEELAELGTTF